MGSNQPAVKNGRTGNPLIRDWEIQFNTGPRQIVAIFLVLITSGILLYHNWWPLQAAWSTRAYTPDPAVYERAAAYDPSNADYHFILAQIYNYSTPYVNLSRARDEYESAVRLNPHRAAHWLELSKYYEQAGNLERCRYAMKMALEKDPNYAQMHWAAANLYIRLNDLEAADFELRRTADLDSSYLTQVLDLVWRFYEDPDRIMSTYVPDTKDADLNALSYFVSQKSERGADLSWAKLKTFETQPSERFGYVDYLVSLGKPHEGWKVFSFPGSAESPSETGFFNPSFETEPLNGGFDWRFLSSEHAEVRRDRTTVKDGLASLLVTFDGTENPDYLQVAHWLPVTKGRRYDLNFWMKTEDISTNEGMFVEVDGAHSSEKQLGSIFWQEFTIPFTAISDLATVRLRRVPSRKFDNLLKGKVWLDAFTLTAVR